MKLLIVEENPGLRRLLRTLLNHSGATLFECTEGAEALILCLLVVAPQLSPYMLAADTPCSISLFLGTSPSVFRGTTSAFLPYTFTMNDPNLSPNLYSIDYDAAAEAAGFADVTDADRPAS